MLCYGRRRRRSLCFAGERDGRTGHHPGLRVLDRSTIEPVVTWAIADSPVMKSMASAIAPILMHRALCLTAPSSLHPPPLRSAVPYALVPGKICSRGASI